MYCPECKFECPDSSNFCSRCGAVFDAGLSSKATDHGERKQVTVLFSDLSGYTAMTEKLDPEDVKEIMGRIFDDISSVIAQYDGEIEKFVGDSVMAVFGVPHAHEDDPIRAIRAARQIHAQVRDLSPQVEKRMGRKLSMHSGINTGLVVTGGPERLKGTHGLVGDAVNLASRLQGLAEADEILVGEDTHRLAATYFTFQAIEPRKVKGKTEPVQAYRVMGPLQEPSMVQRLQGVQAELIGREAQMAVLGGAVEKLQSGQGAIISIVGNAGTGKSRLTKDFKATLDLRQIQWREGHAYPYTQNTPYYPLINLFTHAFQIQEGDTSETIRDKVGTGLKGLLWNRPEIIPYVGGLFSLSYPEIEGVSPEFRREELKQANVEILEALARRGPTVVWFEDLHWADAAFLQLLNHLMINMRLPVLFLLVYRPVFTLFPSGPPADLAWPYQKIELQDLSPDHTRQMLFSLLKARELPVELEKFVQDRVEGNPFYLEEVVNALIESRLLTHAAGQWTLTGPITSAAVPSTIQGVLSARLDRLEAESKRILQQASVIGRAFFFEVLKRISDLGFHLQSRLSGLEKLDLIRARSLKPDLEYIFKHALTQEVVYNGLLKKERKELHERIAAVIEELFRDRLPEFYEALAHHYQRGESFHKAVDYLVKSGQKAVDQFCLEEANHYYQTAYDLLKAKEPLTLEEKTTLIDLLLEWVWVAYFRADFRRFPVLLADHLVMAESIGDRNRYGLFMAWHGWIIFMSGGDIQCLPHLHRALQIAEELNDRRLMAYCCTWLCWAYTEFDLKEKHLFYGDRAIRLAEELGKDHYFNHKALAGASLGYALAGQWKKGLEAAEKAVARGQMHSHLRGMAIGQCFISVNLSTAGRSEEALTSAEAAMEASTDPLYQYAAKSQIGVLFFLTGQMDKALKWVKEACDFYEKNRMRWLGKYQSSMLGVILAALGRLQEGSERIEASLRYAEQTGQKTGVSRCSFYIGLVFSQLAAPPKKAGAKLIMKNALFLLKNLPRAAKKAEEYFKTAIEVGREVGAYQIVANSHLELGRMLLAKRKSERARENLMEAKRIFSELENDFYLQQVEEYLAKIPGGKGRRMLLYGDRE